MIALRLDNLTFSHPGGLVLEELTWAIQHNDKIGLVGPNGAGKSTILKLLTGQFTPDDGFIHKAKGVTVGYLPQEIMVDPQKTVLAEALTASNRVAELETLSAAGRAIAKPSLADDVR